MLFEKKRGNFFRNIFDFFLIDTFVRFGYFYPKKSAIHI